MKWRNFDFENSYKEYRFIRVFFENSDNFENVPIPMQHISLEVY